ncbi:PAN domain-containing protein [Jiella sonneratiae]|uniref:PAN domain-containing protein n=1 Tax=Jiella sonneratiae TaxID=2816856 RepID=A0ABS3IZX8_9HYPH|nr:PAN domain-containing protein [Jiella sonneratiae]MBO0902362.1 PAN domain-containing protein [Jiella sonneratiae]
MTQGQRRHRLRQGDKIQYIIRSTLLIARSERQNAAGCFYRSYQTIALSGIRVRVSDRCFRLAEEISMRRVVTSLFCILLLLFLGVGASRADQEFEDNVDRPGGDYKNFDLNDPTPGSFGGPVDACRIQCEQDGACRAWTFVKKGVQGPKARCWLKTAIPNAVRNGCCTSGVPARSFEAGIDRPGGDYKNFDLPAADANLCGSACNGENALCRAWTFVRPGVQGPKPRCWLKNTVPPAAVNDCCTSGVLGPIVH